MQAPVTHLCIHIGGRHRQDPGIVQQGIDLLLAQVLEQWLLDHFVTPIETDRHIFITLLQRLTQRTAIRFTIPFADETLEEIDIPRQAKLLAHRQEQLVPGGVPGKCTMRIVRHPAQKALLRTVGCCNVEYHHPACELAEYTQHMRLQTCTCRGFASYLRGQRDALIKAMPGNFAVVQ
nr:MULTISPECIES: hypothetical protein [Pseudomonas]